MSKELSEVFNSFINEESENDPSLILDSFDGKIAVDWEDDSPVTPYGACRKSNSNNPLIY